MIQESLKVKNTLTHHRRKHIVSGTTQALFQNQQQQTWPEKTPATVFQRHFALCDIL